jgi:hypothetical protein
MTRPQEALYWREWSACKAERKKRGLPHDDVARHLVHIRALGTDVSMKSLSNGQFDKVLGAFRSWSRSADLNAQLRVEEQPDVRKEISIEKCYEILEELAFYGKEFAGENAMERYLNGTSWALFKRPVRDLSDVEAGKLMGVLLRQLQRVKAKAPKNEQQDTTGEEAPF